MIQVEGIFASSGGETPASANWNDVTFIDYDGSVLYSYSLAEAQALTDLPALPSCCITCRMSLSEITSRRRKINTKILSIANEDLPYI